MGASRWVFLAGILAMLSGCGGDTAISGSANFLNGATKVTARALAQGTGRVADGYYFLTPDKVKFTVVSIVFLKDGGAESSADLTSCVVTYDHSAPSLSKLLSCPFSVAAGTYIGVAVIVNTAYSVLVSTGPIFTVPTAPNLLSTSSTGGDFVTVNANGPAGTNRITTYFPKLLTVSKDAPPSVQIVFEATHMVRTQLTTGNFLKPAFTQGPPFIASVGGVGKAAFYSNLNTALTVKDTSGPGFSATSVQLFYGSDGQPTSAQFTYSPQLLCAAGCASNCAAGPGTSIATGAWNGNQKDLPGRTGDQSYFGIGGYLGMDPAKNISWAFPTNFSFTAWAAVLSMPEKTIVGDTSTLKFACINTDPGPATGTFSAAAPTFTPTATQSLQLVAN